MAACRDAGAKAIAIQGDMAVEADIIGCSTRRRPRSVPFAMSSTMPASPDRTAKLADADLAIIRATIDVNVTGAILVAREAARRMSLSRGGQGGSIVNLSSVAATLGAPNVYVWYAASKGAIDTLTVGLSQELAREGIRVNGVATRHHRHRDPCLIRHAEPDRRGLRLAAAEAAGHGAGGGAGDPVPDVGRVELYVRNNATGGRSAMTSASASRWRDHPASAHGRRAADTGSAKRWRRSLLHLADIIRAGDIRRSLFLPLHRA